MSAFTALAAYGHFAWWQILLYGIFYLASALIRHPALIEQWRGHRFDQVVLGKVQHGISPEQAAGLLNARGVSQAGSASGSESVGGQIKALGSDDAGRTQARGVA